MDRRLLGNARFIGKQAFAVLMRPWCLVVALVSAIALFGFYLLVPILVVPGDTLMFELSSTSWIYYVLLVALAGMTGAIVAFEVFAFRRARTQKLHAARSGTGLMASVFGGVLAAASCGCSTGILLGLFGLGGGAAFVVANQTAIILVMVFAVAIGLYFSARRAAGVCATCTV